VAESNGSIYITCILCLGYPRDAQALLSLGSLIAIRYIGISTLGGYTSHKEVLVGPTKSVVLLLLTKQLVV
jgi:hypothetical protein